MDAFRRIDARTPRLGTVQAGDRPRRLLLAAAAVLALLPLTAGCGGWSQWCHNGFKVGPNYCPPEPSTADAWIDGSDPRVSGGQPSSGCWWSLFGDPALDQLIARASAENLNLKTAGMRILEARAQRGLAVSTLFPQQQEAAAQYSRNAMSQNAYPFNFFPLPKYYYDNWSAGFDAAWELDFWGRFRRGVEAADANLDARVAAYDNVLVLLQAEVAGNYIQMRAFEERLTLAQKNLELQKETLRIATLRERQGMVTELDVQQATAILGATESLIPTLRNGHRRTQNRLCILTGVPPHELTSTLGASGPIPVPPQEVVVGIPAELLRRRPDVRQAEREAAVQSARIGIAQSEFYPHIAITGTIGVQAENANQLFEPASLVGAIGPGIRWNILNYGRIANNVRVEDARFQEAVFLYRETVLRANEEVENGISGFLSEQDRVQALDKSTHAAARSVEIAMRQYEKGVISYQPLLDSQRALVQQQDALTESRGLVGLNCIAVYKALGGGWQARLPSAHPAPPPPAAPLPPLPEPVAAPLPAPPGQPASPP